MSNSLWPRGLQHTRLTSPPPTHRGCSDSYPVSWWCCLTISSSAVPFSFCPQFLPASESFPISQLFIPGGQSTGASASVLPMSIQSWFPLGFTGLISLLSKRLSRVFSSTTVQKHQFFRAQPSLQSSLAHPYMSTGKTIALITWTICQPSNVSAF